MEAPPGRGLRKNKPNHEPCPFQAVFTMTITVLPHYVIRWRMVSRHGRVIVVLGLGVYRVVVVVSIQISIRIYVPLLDHTAGTLFLHLSLGPSDNASTRASRCMFRSTMHTSTLLASYPTAPHRLRISSGTSIA